MKKSLKIIGIFVLIIIVIIILVSIWVNGLMEDQKKTKETMKIVLNSYDNFNNRVEEFSEKRNQFYQYKENLYLETLSTSTEDWDKFMEEYSNSIKEVEKASKNLKNNCKIKYGDVSTNSKCTAFKANYEAAMNYYITDVKVYNKLVAEYTEWNKEGTFPAVKKGTFPVYKKYIDFDGDGEKFGSEVEK